MSFVLEHGKPAGGPTDAHEPGQIWVDLDDGERFVRSSQPMTLDAQTDDGVAPHKNPAFTCGVGRPAALDDVAVPYDAHAPWQRDGRALVLPAHTSLPRADAAPLGLLAVLADGAVHQRQQVDEQPVWVCVQEPPAAPSPGA